MPAARAALSVDDVHSFVDGRCFELSASDRIGVEVEWLAVCATDPASRVPVDIAGTRGAELPAGSRLTFEPGGQIELSAPPLQGIGPACAAIAADAALLSGRLEAHGVGLVGLGLDPRPGRTRTIASPRYDAMERYFDAVAGDSAGRTMMCRTAAVQVNLDIGSTEEAVAARWHRAHDLGPTLAAAFANSPLVDGAPSGWKSRRLVVWDELDTFRSPATGPRDPAAAWTRYALGAHVKMIRESDDRIVPMLEPLTFAEWIAGGHELGYPTLQDLEYHLTTLFPPVRPRGWLELRMIDSLPDPWWRVAVAVATTLVCDDDAADAVAAAVEPTRGRWIDAARHGLEHPRFEASARTCFAAALEAMVRLGTDAPTLLAVEAFVDRYVGRQRCPADDRLDAWATDGALFPAPDHFAEASWV